MDKLLPCPFCGSADINTEGPCYTQFMCNGCGASAYEQSTREEAFAAWNRRLGKGLDGDRSEAEIFAWLEVQAKESRTGISFDWIPACDGEPSGWRFMRRHFISEPHKSLRQAIASAMDFNFGQAFK